MLARSLAFVSMALIAVACAEGGSLEGGGSEGGGDGWGGALASGGGGDGAGSSNSTNSTTATTTSGMGGDGGAGGTGVGGMGEGGMGEGGMGEGGNPGPVCNYTAPEMCAQAEPLMAIAGDEGSPVVTRMGDTSKWFKIHIQEQDSGVFESDLSYSVSLASPPGMDYDLRIHQGAQEGPFNCNGTLKTGSGNPETVSDGWDDSQGVGGEDNSVWLAIEIVHVSGTECGPGNQWTLTVRGNN